MEAGAAGRTMDWPRLLLLLLLGVSASEGSLLPFTGSEPQGEPGATTQDTEQNLRVPDAGSGRRGRSSEAGIRGSTILSVERP